MRRPPSGSPDSSTRCSPTPTASRRDWTDVDPAFTEWCRTLVALRRDHPVFRRRRWFQGHPIRGTEEVLWLRPDGVAMTDNDWDNGYAKSLGVLLDGEAITTADAYGGRVTDDSYLVLLNASELDLPWELPGSLWSRPWVVELDSAGALAPATEFAADATVTIVQRSLAVLRSSQPTTGNAN